MWNELVKANQSESLGNLCLMAKPIRNVFLWESSYCQNQVIVQLLTKSRFVKAMSKEWQNQNKSKHSQTVCLLGAYCKCLRKVLRKYIVLTSQQTDKKKFMRNSNNHIHWKNADFISATASDTAHAQERESVERCCRFGWRFCCKEDNALWQLKVIAALTRAVLP